MHNKRVFNHISYPGKSPYWFCICIVGKHKMRHCNMNMDAERALHCLEILHSPSPSGHNTCISMFYFLFYYNCKQTNKQIKGA